MIKNEKKDILTVGFAIFSVFFGAGNLIFPPTLGILAGDSWFRCVLGFITTGAGLTSLGIIVFARVNGDIDKFSDKISPNFGTYLGVLTAIVIGPLFIIPRLGATVYEIVTKSLNLNISPWILVSVFFLITIFFVLSPSNLIDRLGHILTPILLISVSLIIVMGIIFPAGTPVKTEISKPFLVGLQEGYQTMDALGTIIVINIIIGYINKKEYTDEKTRRKFTNYVAIIAGLLLGVLYMGLTYVGATISGEAGSQISRVDSLINISRSSLGNFSGTVLSIAVTFACLTTAIGLTASTSEFFEKTSKGKIKYRLMSIFTVVFSTFIAAKGVDFIVKISVPILLIVYPVMMVLICLNILGKWVDNKMVYRGAVLGAVIVGLLQGFDFAFQQFFASESLQTLLKYPNDIINKFPLADKGFHWIVPAIALGLIFFILQKAFKIGEEEK